MIALTFGGWFQCRLSTDPDPSDEPRGVTGWTFAWPGEPDLDRIISFRNPAWTRSHTPPVDVRVSAVSIDGTPAPGHPLEGAEVDLLGEPTFEGRNGLVAPPGVEPIVPFRLSIAGNGIRLVRHDDFHPGGEDLVVTSWMRRRFAGRVENQPPVPQEIADAAGIDPDAYGAARAAVLREELASATDPLVRTALEQRLARAGRPMMMRVTYDFPIGELGGHVDVADDARALPRPVDTGVPWPIRFWMGAWDADAMCGYVHGTLQVPLLGGQ